MKSQASVDKWALIYERKFKVSGLSGIVGLIQHTNWLQYYDMVRRKFVFCGKKDRELIP